MVSWFPMENNPNRSGRTFHGVRMTPAEWQALQRIAGALGCLGVDALPSISRMLVELTQGSLSLVRLREAAPRSQAEIIRAALAANPDLDDRGVARKILADSGIWVDVNYLRLVRKRARG